MQEERETEWEINRRLTTIKRATTALNSVLRSRDIKINTKKIIYNTNN